MAKIITQLYSEHFGAIKIDDFLFGGHVKSIIYIEDYTVGIIEFREDSTKTLEVFDVNYVIRDEE